MFFFTEYLLKTNTSIFQELRSGRDVPFTSEAGLRFTVGVRFTSSEKETMLGLSRIYLELYLIARFLLASSICDLPHKTERNAISGVWHLVDNLRRCELK